MNPTKDTQPIPIESDELNEIELQAPEERSEEILAPEDSMGTAKMTIWNEPADAVTQRVPFMPLESEETIAEQLVNSGNEEADFEQREAAADEEQL